MVTTHGAGQILFELLAGIIILVLTAKATFPVSASHEITRESGQGRW
jgi:phosphate/sulfate permease